MSESFQHHNLVRYLVAHAGSHGVWVAAAALPGYAEPPAMRGRRPDMLGWLGDKPIVGEAELGRELHSQHTQEQLAAFSRWHYHGLPATVALAVPPRWGLRARAAALAAGVPAERLVIVTPPVRVRRGRTRPARPLMQRGRGRPVTPPGILLQRGRERPVLPPGIVYRRGRQSARQLTQTELAEQARRVALRRLVRRG